MKFVFVPLLMLLLLTQTFSKWMVVIGYQMNKDYVAQQLCVNKAKPIMHCNGKCQMMKRLAEEEKESSSNTSNNTSKIKLQELVFSNKTNTLAIPLLETLIISHNEAPPVFIRSLPSASIFHPPLIS